MNSNDASPRSILAPSASLWSKAPVVTGASLLPRTRVVPGEGLRRATPVVPGASLQRATPVVPGAGLLRTAPVVPGPSLLPTARVAAAPLYRLEPNGPTRVELRVEDAFDPPPPPKKAKVGLVDGQLVTVRDDEPTVAQNANGDEGAAQIVTDFFTDNANGDEGNQRRQRPYSCRERGSDPLRSVFTVAENAQKKQFEKHLEELKARLKDYETSTVSGTLTSSFTAHAQNVRVVLESFAGLLMSVNSKLCFGGAMSIGATPSMVHLFGGASQIRFFGDELNSIETALCNEAVASAEEVVRQNWEELEAQAEWAHMILAQQANQLYRSEGVPLVLESKMAVPFSVIDEVAGLMAQKFEGTDVNVAKHFLLAARKQNIQEQKFDVNEEWQCPCCDKTFVGIQERFDHLKSNSICFDAVVRDLAQDEIHVCNGTCGDVLCRRAFVTPWALKQHKEHAPDSSSKQRRILSRELIKNRVPLRLEEVDALGWNEASDYAWAMGLRHLAKGQKRDDFREVCKSWFVGRETEAFVPSLDVANRKRDKGDRRDQHHRAGAAAPARVYADPARRAELKTKLETLGVDFKSSDSTDRLQRKLERKLEN